MVLDLINKLLPSIEHFQVWGYWIAFFAALFETTVGIGLILPGSTIILFLGALSARGYLDVGDLIWFSTLGAIFGDNINYTLGKKYGAKWLKDGLWLLKTSHVEKAKDFMGAHGAKSVFFGRFIPTVKEIVPFIAGSLKMDKKTFMLWNILGAIGWGFEWVLAGYIFAQSLNLAQVWLSRTGLFFAFLFIFVIFLSMFRWLMIRKGKQFLAFFSSFGQSIKKVVTRNNHLMLWAQKHPRPLSFITARMDTTAFSGLTLSIFTLALVYVLALFAGVVEDFITSDSIIAVDIRMADLISVFRTQGLTDFFTWITLLGKTQVILVFIFVSTLLLWLWQKKYCILPLYMAVAGSEAFTHLGKLAFHRPRPDMAVYLEHSFSFPSGHATIAVSFYGFLGYLLMGLAQNWNKKVNILFSTLVLILAIGFSRIYLGVHYISDVWSGYLVGAIWLILAVAFSEWLRHKERPQSKPFFAGVRLITFILVSMAVLFYIGFAAKYYLPSAPASQVPTIVVSKATDIFTNEQIKYTETLTGSRQEPINCIFIARDNSQLISIFHQAGWTLTDRADISSFFRAVKTLILKTPHPRAPISPSFWHAKTQDISFAKTARTNWLINAHHVKIWRTHFVLKNGNYVYVGLVNANDGFNWGIIPKIAPDLDIERERLFLDLNRAKKRTGSLKEQLVAPQIGKNFIGNPFFTDGKVYIIPL